MLNLKLSFYFIICIKQLKLIKILDNINRKANDIGKKTFQPNLINWSYLYLGNVPLIKINKNIKNNVFNANHTVPGIYIKGQKFNKGYQPPKKRITVKLHIKIILLYSAKKNKAKLIAEYSTL